MTIESSQARQCVSSDFSGENCEIFDNIFDFFGTLDAAGRVLNLSGRIFKTTNTEPNLLLGQQFAQTVFWQSSENTSRIVEKAIEKALSPENIQS